MLMPMFVAIVTALAGDAPAQESGPVDRTGANPSTPVRRPGMRERSTDERAGGRFNDPRRWVFIAVVGFLAIGGGRKWLTGRRGRAMADKLAENTASPEEILSSAKFGRIVVHDLFRAMSEAPTPEHRLAATESLVALWKADELIPEEEKAIVNRSLFVDWQIRRKYPKGLRGPIGIRVRYGMPTLANASLNAWLHEHLRWSHRVTGTRRAADDVWANAGVAPPRHHFEFMGEDFPDDGPHRLILHLKVATHALTDNWTLELPAQSTSFEWDDKLQSGALAGMPDSGRAEAWRKVIELSVPSGDDATPVLVVLDDRFAIRNPPLPMIAMPMPSDMAHAAFLELENVAGRWSVGEWIEPTVSAVGGKIPKLLPEQATPEDPPPILDRGGAYRARFVLEPRPERGWSDPAIRSVWPERIESDWTTVEIVRR
jgi:hypothetical protein